MSQPGCLGSRATNPHRCSSSPYMTTPEETMYTLGIDLHKDESHVVVLGDNDEIVDEVRVLDANLEEIARQYAGSKAVIEATSNYYSVYDTLDEYFDIVVADPNQTKALGVVEAKNDRLDAKLLAQLRSAGMIAESYVPSKELMERRALVRGENNWWRNERTSKTKFTLYLSNRGSAMTGTHSPRKVGRSSPTRISHRIRSPDR